jgi:hypothetical protein
VDADDQQDSGDVRNSFGCLLWVFIPLGLLMGVLALQYGLNGGWWLGSAVIVAVYFAVGFGRWPWFLARRQRELAQQRVPSASDDELNTTTHVRTVEVPVPATAAYDSAIAWIRRSVMGVRFKETDREKGVIRGRTWDCHITVEITALTDHSSEVRIEGHPRRFQLFDDGKNLGNVVELEAWLREHTRPGATIEGHAGAPERG